MIIDTSVASAIESAGERRISAAGYLEAALVVDNRGDAVARREFDRFFERAGITIEPVTLEHAQIARQAYMDFGKGRHRAKLNFGDCLAYALARSYDQPLLYKGRDFRHTDLQSALKQ
jgi:ribonuclease VapC